MTNIQLYQEWRAVPGYEGIYEVSHRGNIRTIFGNIIKGHAANGYRRVCLIDGRSKNHAVHRLVALAFITNPQSKPHTNHIDYNRGNNHVSNLEWCTHSENMIHGQNPLTRGNCNPYTPLYRRSKNRSRKVTFKNRLPGEVVIISEGEKKLMVKELKKYIIDWPRDIAKSLKKQYPKLNARHVYYFFEGIDNPYGREIMVCAEEKIREAEKYQQYLSLMVAKYKNKGRLGRVWAEISDLSKII